MRSILHFTVAAVVSLALVACSGSKSLDFKQLYVGSNGPEMPSASVYGSADAVEKSWIGSALTQDQRRDVLSAVDFQKNLLLAFAAGQEMLPSESSIDITQVRQIGASDMRPINVTVEVARCGDKISDSTPFVLAIIEMPMGTISGIGYDYYSSDICRNAGVSRLHRRDG